MFMNYSHKLLIGLLVSLLAAHAWGQQAGVFEEVGVNAVFSDADNNLVEFEDGDLQAGRFVFHVWLEDLEGGFDLNNPLNPPSDDEKNEFAPSFSQNLVAAFVGYQDDDGEVYPVAGAQVRWLIDEGWDDAVGSTLFGAADAGGEAALPGDLGIVGNQAITLTNNANIYNRARFPIATDYPLRNATGLGSPDTGGVTWVTLFSPDRRARARVLAVATVNGVEIGKELVIKNFAPQPELQLEKTVNEDTINLIADEQAEVTFDVVVTNTGSGDALNVQLDDQLTSGSADAYSLVGRDGDSFTETFDIPAGESRRLTFDAVASAAGNYCNTAIIRQFTDEFNTIISPELTSQACFDVVSPELNIIKDFINVERQSLGDAITVGPNEEAILRVRVINRGSGPANDLVITDELTSGNADAYQLVALPEGIELIDDDSFSSTFESLAVDTAATLIFTVSASEDGEYCDTASYTVEGEEGGQDQACLTVTSPELTIDKVNDRDAVLPGNTYESTITLTNIGQAVAEDVLLTDLIGTNTAGDVQLVYVSSDVEREAGAFDDDEGLVAAPALVDLAPDQSLILNVTTRVPEGIRADQFCNIARYESSNAGEGEVEACVDVPAFAALQTRMIDQPDPILAGDVVQYTSTIYVEARSNESVSDNQVSFTFGSEDAGSFNITGAQVFLVNNPSRDANTGLVTADAESGQELVLDEDFTVTGEGNQQTISLNANLTPNSAVFFLHEVTVAEGASAGNYNSSYDWTATGVDSGTQYSPQNSEPTTVVNP
jgi:uncharacterized repeat protein (TIGR01451 family)